MPRRRSALKRLRVDKKRRLHNLKIKQQLKKTIKKFRALLSAKNSGEAKALLSKVYSLLDKAAKKNIIPANTASRKKSRLAKSLLKNYTT
ncbi:MAG: 30S ribosomal protein S20 [Candidatus Omnitrophica bacterium]|nr:30S ribosomal protein S20 [Candidatus Omnitrophota bacterium]MBU4346680.1 30S ribosomal protein S20 [Candidatus Omnitrophota bacterium]MBU4473485.1 30S ribosomal protein S20 [Candidatus Omnitrophota bacterium]MCG2706920.1 30S ribosomal protein S20 [Candidatus Omnitrophota bacterium]